MKRRPEAQAPGPTQARAPDTADMRAMVQDRYGATDVLPPTRIAYSEVTAHEVLVRVHGAFFDRARS